MYVARIWMFAWYLVFFCGRIFFCCNLCIRVILLVWNWCCEIKMLATYRHWWLNTWDQVFTGLVYIFVVVVIIFFKLFRTYLNYCELEMCCLHVNLWYLRDWCSSMFMLLDPCNHPSLRFTYNISTVTIGE